MTEPAIDTIAREMLATFGLEASLLISPVTRTVRVVAWCGRGYAIRDGVRIVPLLLGPCSMRDAPAELRSMRERANR